MDRYGLPNDDAEQLREGIKHTMYVDYILDGNLFAAPIKEYPQKIVDLGTGVGFWAMDGKQPLTWCVGSFAILTCCAKSRRNIPARG